MPLTKRKILAALLPLTWAVALPAMAWDLDRAWALAVQNLPALRGAQARTDALRARVDAAAAPLWPTASVDISQAVQTANFVQRPGAVPRSLTSAAGSSGFSTSPALYPFFQLTGNVRWTVWDFGRTAASVAAADAATHSAQANEQAVRQRLWLQVAAGYLQALAADAAVEVAQDTLVLVQKRRDLVKIKVDAEARPLLDLLRAQSDVQSAEVTLMRAQDEVHNARLALGLAIGLDRPVDEALELPRAASLTIDDAVLHRGDIVAQWLQQALRVRPELRSIDADIDAARAQLQALALMAAPSMFVAGQAAVAGTDFTALAYNLSASAGASLPLSGLWMQGPQAAELRAVIRQLQADRAAILLQVRGELDSARQWWLQARRRRQPLVALFALADKAYDHARARYQAGATALVDVIDTEFARNQAKLQLAQLDLDEALAVARWRAAMGQIAG